MRDRHTPVSVIIRGEGHFIPIFFAQDIRPASLHFHGFISFQLDTQLNINHFFSSDPGGGMFEKKKKLCKQEVSSAQYYTLSLVTLTVFIHYSAQLNSNLCLRAGAKGEK